MSCQKTPKQPNKKQSKKPKPPQLLLTFMACLPTHREILLWQPNNTYRAVARYTCQCAYICICNAYILFSSISSSVKASSSNRFELHHFLSKDSQKTFSLPYTENNLMLAWMQTQFQTNFRQKIGGSSHLRGKGGNIKNWKADL